MEKVQDINVLGLVFLVMILGLSMYGEAESKGFLVNCGSNSSVKADSRTWVGDLVPKNNVTLSSSTGIVASTATLSGYSVFSELYKSTRIFENNLSYTFQVTKGTHFVRLHFCPFEFENHNVNGCSFDVIANGLKLLSQFGVAGEIAHSNLHLQLSGGNSSVISLVKEYILPVNADKIVIEFIPNKGSFGFVNAIEVIPIVDKLFADSVTRVGGNEVNLNLTLSESGIETMYRMNVGGPEIMDTNLWRKWETDSSYMITETAGSEISSESNANITFDSLVAPLGVYETARAMSNNELLEKRFNMSWKFEVDPDFDYLVRLHFCELAFDKESQRIFRIYINNRTAENNFDIYAHAGGKNKAYHQDYYDAVSSKIDTLWIQLGPDTAADPLATDALLNGLEVFKLSRNGNLARLEKFDVTGRSLGNSKQKIIWVIVTVSLGSIAIMAVLVTSVICLCKKRKKKTGEAKKWQPLVLLAATGNSVRVSREGSGKGSMTTRVGKRFTLNEIRAGTNNFDETLVIGVGGFGKVYKGEIEAGTPVAIKRANPQSQQGLAEFDTEIELLSKLRHRHLVSLVGFCEEKNEMILVYEYMANGTLRSHLFGSDHPPLTWEKRLEACIGAARGLHYLHTGADGGIIHRDIKTTNILLDENFVAKMSDFGLSRTGPALDHTHVSTAVKGSFGYLDPEYFRRQQLTEKSDVYSFGVVLFEAVCGRAVINPSLPKEEINLAEWAMKWQRQKSLETIIDPNLKKSYSAESFVKLGEIAEKCLADEGKNRPSMGEVLWHLEYVLQLHQAWLCTKNGESQEATRGVDSDSDSIV